MSIIKRNNGLPAQRLFDDFFSRDLWNWGSGNHSLTQTSIPAVNIVETADAFKVEMAAPGMKKEDFRVELEGTTLTISSTVSNEAEEKEGERFTRREFSYQSFQRTFVLPKEVVDDQRIEARYEQGVLNLVIPKKEEAKQRPPRKIEIM